MKATQFNHSVPNCSSHTHRLVFYYPYSSGSFIWRKLILDIFNTTFSDVLGICCPYVISLSSNKSESHHNIQMKQRFLLPGFSIGIWKGGNESVLPKYINNLLISLTQKYIIFSHCFNIFSMWVRHSISFYWCTWS